MGQFFCFSPFEEVFKGVCPKRESLGICLGTGLSKQWPELTNKPFTSDEQWAKIKLFEIAKAWKRK